MAAIKKEFSIEAKLKKGPVGIFDVYIDEWVVYSNRRECGRLPKNDEIISKIKDYQTRPTLPTKGVPSNTKNATAEGGKPEATSGSQCGCG